ncbi:Lrp/AsnC family transcriptional regulator [Halorarum salinum]|uniref:Lrp/AsnC family transcriptional regulator n=1 Tax=Halorarum salinum TaxID=2743089 RepID=A0A7D5LCN1_9EURY|nr:Lrp/AsnC family transcriptional regulator [Halobaculum salinum]QLG63411.1 Lrp/AsnC family transcriptional regulator [Halobaculum salinum]
MSLDDRDLEILKTIADIGEASPKRLADETDTPKSTVHYRLQNLREDGVIENDLFEVDPKSLGLSVTVISEVMAEYEEGYHETVGSQLAAIDGVSGVYFTMGDTDFIVTAHLPNSSFVQDLVESYEAVDGVERTSSKFVISTIKEEPNPLRNYDIETLKQLDLSPDP